MNNEEYKSPISYVSNTHSNVEKRFNPLYTVGIFFNKHNFMYKVLAPSIITPI